MPPRNRLTLMLPEMGLVSRYGKTPQRFVRIKDGSLADGDILLQLTLRELHMIRQASREMNIPRPQLFEDAKAQCDDFEEELERLASALESTSWFNFVKRLEIRRNTHALVEAGYELYVETKTTSGRMQRGLLSCNSLVEEVREGEVVQDEPVRGIAVDIEGSLDDEIASIVSDPFSDPITPGSDDRITCKDYYLTQVEAQLTSG